MCIRDSSISTSVIPIEWEGYKINIIDTPGYFDFVGEVEEAVSAAGAAIIVVNGKSGIDVGTQKAWELCEKYKLPRFIYVSNMDVDNASFRQVVEDMTNLYGKKMAPFHLPIRENATFRAENSNTTRHAAEFWMIEPEICFADLKDDMIHVSYTHLATMIFTL